MEPSFSLLIILAGLFIIIAKGLYVLREYERAVIFRFGRLASGIVGKNGPGIIIILPLIDKLLRVSLRTVTMDVPPQDVITKDNVSVKVNAVIYFRVVNAEKAIVDVEDYYYATSMIAQTTLRSIVGQVELDEVLTEREKINSSLQEILDKQTDPWGVKVLRYEIKNINPPSDVLEAMEKQMRAEREKRAVILTSEGDRDSKINQAEGDKQKVIKQSEANKLQQINEAEGEGQAILTVANATAEGINAIAAAVRKPGGSEAVQLRVAEQYIGEFGNLAKSGNSLIVPSNLSDVSSMIASAMSVIKQQSNQDEESK